MDLVKIGYDSAIGITVSVHGLIIIISIVSITFWLLIRWKFFRTKYSEFEIDEAEIGIGNHKIKIKPNVQDLQISYQLWVELSTRKIGLLIDKE